MRSCATTTVGLWLPLDERRGSRQTEPMGDTIYPVVSVGNVEGDIVGEVLPVTIRLNREAWELLTSRLHGYVPFGMLADTPPLDLRERIRELIETMLVNEMLARDYFAEFDNGPGA